jgi:hypothetical protein
MFEIRRGEHVLYSKATTGRFPTTEDLAALEIA